MPSLADDLNTLRIYGSGLSPMAGKEGEQEEGLTPATADVEESPSPVEEPATEASIQPIDLLSLADRIYALFKQELRLERERLGRNSSC